MNLKNPVIITEKTPEIGFGHYGSYYRLSKTVGIKIGKYRDREVRNLVRLNKLCPGIFPKFYGVVSVQIGEEIRKGILMEHISGKTFTDANVPVLYSKAHIKAEQLKKRLAQAGIRWTDGHRGNMIITRTGRVRFVDAGGYMYFYGHPLKLER